MPTIGPIKGEISMAPNTSAIYHSIAIDDLIKDLKKEEVIVLSEVIVKNEIVSDNITYFAEPKDIELFQPEVIKTFSISEDGKTQLTLSSKTLVKDVFITLDGASLKLSDNYFDLLPNIDKTVTFEAAEVDASKIEIKSLFDTF